jgi:HlyD family secretion protein
MNAAFGATDAPRAHRVSRTLVRVIVVLVAAVLLAAAAWYGLRASRETLRTVDADALVFDTVTRGALVREVNATGTFVSNSIRYASAPAEAEVAAVAVRPGGRVVAGQPLVVLRSAELEAAIPDELAQLAAAVAEQHSAEAAAKTASFDARSSAESLHAQHKQAQLEARVDADLSRQGLIGSLQAGEATIKADDLGSRARLEDQRGASDRIQQAAKIAEARARVADVQALLAAKRAQLASLTVRANGEGVVQDVAAQVGQRVSLGTTLVRIADQADLKAVLAVADTDVREVAPGDPVTLHAGNVVVRGRVTRIAPAGNAGNVSVDVALLGPNGSSAVRPDVTVDGAIEVARLSNVLTVARPAGADDDAAVALYKVVASGTELVRVPVRLGRGSLERVRVVTGLTAGDRVVVSDTSAYGADMRLRLRTP